MPAGLFMRITVLFSLSLMPGISATASDEPVLIRKVVRNKAILVRGKQEFYLIQTSVRCRSLVSYEGKMALVRSPETFLGPQSRLVLAGPRQPCRITKAAFLDENADSFTHTLEEGCGDRLPAVMAVQEALMLLGRDPGAVGSKREALKA